MAETSSPRPPIGAARRIWLILTAPRQGFATLEGRSDWVAPIGVLVVLSVILTASIGHRVGWRAVIEKRLENNPRVAELTPEQRQQMLAQAERSAPVVGYAGAVVGQVLGVVVTAGALWAVFALGFGAAMPFSLAVSVASYGFLPLALQVLIGIGVVWLGPPENLNLENLVASNVAAFLAATSPAWLRTLAASVDLFTLWTLGLLIIGFPIATGNAVSRGRSRAAVLSLWLLYVAAKTTLVAIFS